MKQETREVIGERLNKLNKYLHKAGGRFRAETIHSFRLEVKKLRSFLTLLSLNGHLISLPKRLKKLYRLLGRIRLVQLQSKTVFEVANKCNKVQPVHYLISLENERSKLKKEAKKYIRKMKPLKIKSFGKNLPDEITKENSLKYFTLEENKLVDLLHLPNPDEESLHGIRKIMKGMLYDLPYLKDRRIRDRELNKTRTADMKVLESKIGEFHDISTSLRLLNEALKDSSEKGENHCLTLILSHWQKDKENLKRQITDLELTLSDKNNKTA